MNVASELRTGRLVRAADALRGRLYRCPSCQADVFPRLGLRRDPHFAHWPGQGSAACELFHVGQDVQHPWPSIPDPNNGDLDQCDPIIPPLSVSIELEPEVSVRNSRLRQWGLRLTIPKSSDAHGRVTIDFGNGDLRTIALSKLALGALTNQVDVEAAHFGAVWISPEVRPRFRAALEGRVPGLERAHINAFAATAQKFKPSVNRISWGQTYYFVWRAESDIVIPPVLPNRPLARRGAWACALVALPDEADEAISTWLQKACAHPVSREGRRWSVVYPVAYDIDISGNIVLPPAVSVLVGIENTDERQDGQTRLDCTVHDACASVVLPAGGRRLLEINTDGAQKDGQIRLTWDGKALPPIIRGAPISISALPAVACRFRPTSGGVLHEARLHEALCHHLLQQARSNTCVLDGITVPMGIAGSLNWRGPEDHDWQTLSLTDANPPGTANIQYDLVKDDIARINTALQALHFTVRLEFGAFGEFHARAQKPQRNPLATEALSQDLRQRIIWLCKNLHHYPSDGRGFDHINDVDLVSHFETAPDHPIFITHKRFLNDALLRPRIERRFA